MRRHTLHGRALIACLLLVPCLAACGAGLEGGWPLAALAPLVSGALALLALAGPGATRARAGAPVGCDGYEERACEGGHVVTHCCPKGAKCNFESPAYLECGDRTCVVGGDRGRCPAPTAMSTPAKDEAECRKSYGEWAPACVDHRVQNACIPMPPTNYSGPSANPPFQTCGTGMARDAAGARFWQARCTTHVLAEDCYPTRAELGQAPCDGAWTKVCLGGKIQERCMPPFPSASRFPAMTFVACPDASCAVGTDKHACP